MNAIFLALRLKERVDELLTDWQIFYSKTETGYFTSFSWFHNMWLVIMIAACIILSIVFARKHDKKIDDIIIFSIGAFLITIELYKQVFNTKVYNHYQWYIFPFQFCSVPMYVAFIAPLLRHGRVKDAMYKFLSFYGLLAGISVMLYPDSCFTTHYITMLIHTMIWHVSMVVMGVYLIVAKEYCKSIKNYFKEALNGGIILVIIVAMAVIANVVGYKYYFGTPLNTGNDTFWLMYISPYYPCPLPVLGTIKEAAPYPVFLLCYILAFTIGITLLWFAVYGIRKLVNVLAIITAKEKAKHLAHNN